MKIDLPLFDVSYCKITQKGEHFILLEEEKLVYRANYWADEPVNINDVSLGENNVLTDLEVSIKKHQIVGVEKIFLIPPKSIWKISLLLAAAESNPLYFFVKNKKECVQVYDKLSEYIFNRT